MNTNPNLLIPIYRVYSKGVLSTFLGLEEATSFLRAEAGAGHAPLSLEIQKATYSDYLIEVESQEKGSMETKEGAAK